MNWQDAHDLCDELRRELEDLRFPIEKWLVPLPLLAETWRKLDHFADEAIADAVLGRVAEGRWPPLDTRTAELIYLRVAAADTACETLAFVEQYRPQPASIPARIATDRRELIPWLLLELWEHVGFGAIDGSLERLRDVEPPSTSGEN